ncbi:MAG: ATP-binding protein [Acidobacteriota bacterium]
MRTKKLLFSLEVLLVFLTLTLYLWYTIRSSDQQKQAQSAEISANQLKNGIESFVDEKISILLQVRNFWLNSEHVSHDEFLSFCREIISQIPGFQAIEYGDANNRVVWVEPFVTNDDAGHFDVSSQPLRYGALKEAITQRTISVTPSLDLAQGGKGFIAIIPLFRKEKYEGSIFGVFRVDTIFNLIFDSILKQKYDCAVYDGDRLIYGTTAGRIPDLGHFPIVIRKEVSVRHRNWVLTLWPKDYAQEGNYLSLAVLLLGIALSAVLGSLVWVLSSKAEQADLYAALVEAAHTLGAAREFQQVCKAISDTCLKMTGVDRCALFQWNESDMQFEPAWISITKEEEIQQFKQLRLKYSESAVLRQLVNERKSLIIAQDAQKGAVRSALAAQFNVRSMFVAPMVSKGRLTGVVTLDSQGKRHRFSDSQRFLIEGIASQAAIALENANLLAETKKQSELIANKNKELESLLFIVSHDLRNPLVALSGMAGLLQEECKDQLTENGQHYLNRIVANIGNMETLISDVMTVSRIGRAETQIETINVDEVLEEVLDNFKEQPTYSKVRILNRNVVQQIRYNRSGLKHIFSNLIGNALKFSAYQENAQVVIGSENCEQGYRFYVQDNGIGIDRKYHQRVFDLFYRLQELRNVQGTGVGLTIVQRVLETYGGSVWLNSEKGKGTTFYFLIPANL